MTALQSGFALPSLVEPVFRDVHVQRGSIPAALFRREVDTLTLLALSFLYLHARRYAVVLYGKHGRRRVSTEGSALETALAG